MYYTKTIKLFQFIDIFEEENSKRIYELCGIFGMLFEYTPIVQVKNSLIYVIYSVSQ